MIDRLRSSVAPRFRRWAAAVLAATAVANLALTPFVPEQAQPFRWHADGDLRSLVFSERDSVTLRYAIYEDLRVIAGGGTLVVPSGRLLDEYLVDGMSLMTLETREYDPAAAIPPTVDAAGDTDASAAYDDYVIVDGPGDVWWVGFSGRTIVILPASTHPIPESTP